MNYKRKLWDKKEQLEDEILTCTCLYDGEVLKLSQELDKVIVTVMKDKVKKVIINLNINNALKLHTKIANYLFVQRNCYLNESVNEIMFLKKMMKKIEGTLRSHMYKEKDIKINIEIVNSELIKLQEFLVSQVSNFNFKNVPEFLKETMDKDVQQIKEILGEIEKALNLGAVPLNQKIKNQGRVL